MPAHVENQGKDIKTPRNFAIDPSGRWCLVANQASDSVIVFKVDQETGKLEPTDARVKIGNPVCLRFLPGRADTPPLPVRSRFASPGFHEGIESLNVRRRAFPVFDGQVNTYPGMITKGWRHRAVGVTVVPDRPATPLATSWNGSRIPAADRRYPGKRVQDVP